ncbi:hypothetical protein BO79DRAFT_278199 [Aspergillus costaricaensis CBS 115574]|uniref:Uncharacterized protein n=1 Tax=Aspergillus costaricaensis CBS 115574 TaxID=1448317 RepID=A0ACD1INW5_9EURO|nr:hypothetical protein BO79DRAFT_278199 [Aspergillus costaricaensis CBS 115574]RAK91728.1 hypothetical protein BO79DRAFT_278199 [Aspergillus costaricaensis CBS 115574]
MRLHEILIGISVSLVAGASAANSTLPQCAVCSGAIGSPCPRLTRTIGYLSDASSSCQLDLMRNDRYNMPVRQCGIPVHKGRPAVEAATIVPLVISTLLFLNRILAKIMGLGGGWGADDVTITIAWALAVGIFGVNVKMIELGFGKNMWDIIPMDNITLIFKCFQGFVVMYKTQVSLAKISVCLFLLRIFQSNLFRYTTWAVIGLNAAIGITWVLTDSFRCIPVHLAWTQWEGLETGRCVDFIAVTFANAFVNIAVDIIMVLMPVYEVTKLNLSARKKLGVSVMFAMGLVLTAVAIIRVVVFWYNRWNTNLTEQLQPIVHWSVLETQIAVMCACLPTFRAMLVHLFPKVLGNTSDHSTYGKRNTPSGGAAFGSQQPLSKSHINKTVSYSVDYGGKKKPQRSSFVQLVELDPQAHP